MLVSNFILAAIIASYCSCDVVVVTKVVKTVVVGATGAPVVKVVQGNNNNNDNKGTTTVSPSPAASSSDAPSSSGSTSSGSFQDKILAEHNKKRALKGKPALTWDTGLENFAKGYAPTFCSNGMVHSSSDQRSSVNAGENLYMTSSTDSNDNAGIDATDAWYDEVKDYTTPQNSDFEKTGHYTQLVWKSTTKLGCALYVCKSGDHQGTYVNCNYSPPGNMQGNNWQYYNDNV